MTESVVEFARRVSAASQQRIGFAATQSIESSGLSVIADIHKHDERRIQLTYRSYESPWMSLEETLSGHVEFTGEELCELTLQLDGKGTWIVNPSTHVVIRKTGSRLFEPLPGLSALGEISFLDTLTHDYLLRDLGEHPKGEMTTRRLGLKPKRSYRSRLLSATSFPFRSASIDFDPETAFPTQIVFYPSEDSPAGAILGPNAAVTIAYSEIKRLEDAPAFRPFEPSADAQVFRESVLPVSELVDRLPFDLPLERLSPWNLAESQRPAVLTFDETAKRGYVSIQADRPHDDDQGRAHLSLLVGNYVSRNMARRRTTLSEHGTADEQIKDVTLLDRTPLWEEQFPGIDAHQAPKEGFFERDGVFWFLSITGGTLEEAAEATRSLASSPAAPSDIVSP